MDNLHLKCGSLPFIGVNYRVSGERLPLKQPLVWGCGVIAVRSVGDAAVWSQADLQTLAGASLGVVPGCLLSQSFAFRLPHCQSPT